MIGISALLIMLLSIHSGHSMNRLKLVKEWKELDFSFPNKQLKIDAENKRHFIPGSSVPIDVDVYYEHGGRSRIFVTIPRFDQGRPFTLATISTEPDDEGMSLKPYPNYSWHENQGNDCNGITSVYRVAIDACSRLWVLDTGLLSEKMVCPPQLLVFDLTTDRLLHRHKINPDAVRPQSIFVTPVVDVRDPKRGCHDTFVYMADITAYAMIVYDHSTDSSWRVENKYFYPYPSEGTFSIAGESFDLMDGILGMALSPLYNNDRILYFHALASVTENYVKTSILRNATAWRNQVVDPRHFKVFDKTRSSQSAAEAMDKHGILYFGLATPTAIGCWDSSKPYSKANIDIIAEDPEKLQFASGVKIINNLKGEQELWVLTCRFQRVMTGSMTPQEVNFRIQAGKVNQLTKGTKCAHPNEPPRPGHSGISNFGDVMSF